MTATYRPGDHVTLRRDGIRPGVILSEYMPGMYEVRLAAGDIVVPTEELTPAWSPGPVLRALAGC